MLVYQENLRDVLPNPHTILEIDQQDKALDDPILQQLHSLPSHSQTGHSSQQHKIIYLLRRTRYPQP
jgi:hypothetical protein